MSRTKKSAPNTTAPDLDEARATLRSIEARKVTTRAQLEAARRESALHSTGGIPPAVQLAVKQGERDLASLDLEEHDARASLQDALFASEVANGNEDAVAVFELFDKLSNAGDRAADLSAQIERLYLDASASFKATQEAHARLNQRRAAAGDPLAPKPCDRATALVHFLRHVPPAARTASKMREVMGVSTDIEALVGATLNEKARALITGAGRPRTGLVNRLQTAERDLFDANRHAMEWERKQAAKAEEKAKHAQWREEELKAEARRAEAKRAEDEAQRAKRQAENDAVIEWAAAKRAS